MAEPFQISPVTPQRQNISGFITHECITAPDGTSSPSDIAIRDFRLEEESSLIRLESPAPERASELHDYYNQTLQSIDLLRYPIIFPHLVPAQPPDPTANKENEIQPIVKKMIATDTPVKTTEAEEAQLRETLSIVPPDILKFCSDNGVKFQVVHQGDDLATLKVLRPKKEDELMAKLPEMEKFGRSLNEQVEAKFERRIRKLEKERDALLEKQKDPSMSQQNLFWGLTLSSSATADPKVEKLNNEIEVLKSEEGKFIAEEIKKSGLDVIPYIPPMPKENSLGFSGAALMTRMPISLEVMAEQHGAETPAEKEQFYKAVQALNGDKLKEARDAFFDEQMKNLDSIPDREEKEKARSKVKQAIDKEFEGHPEKIPMNYQKVGILVPNTYFYRSGGSDGAEKLLILDYHDFGTAIEWNDNRTGKINSGKDENGDVYGVMGQHFGLGDVNRILVRDFRIQANTSVHELGHSIEYLVEKKDPDFYKEWSERVKKSYENVGRAGGSSPISDYSRVNTNEYVAEGFYFYHKDPVRLKDKDKELHNLIEELLNRARALNQN